MPFRASFAAPGALSFAKTDADRNTPSVESAFVLGAGLGTRLRPLTADVPKPLVPVLNRPLISHVFDHLVAQADIGRFIVNTHHRPERYREAFPEGTHRGRPIVFRHEPVRLETGGGLANIRDLVDGPGPLLVCNGDLLTDLPLAPLIEAHAHSHDLVTLALRSSGPQLHVAFEPATGRIVDIRDLLGTGAECAFQFTGIYLVSPEFLDWLDGPRPHSVIPVFLEAIHRGGRIGGVVIDEGEWLDLGTRDAYLAAHAARLAEPLVDGSAEIGRDAVLTGATCVGPGARVGARARLEDTILWPGAEVGPGVRLRRCVVRDRAVAATDADNRDF